MREGVIRCLPNREWEGQAWLGELSQTVHWMQEGYQGGKTTRDGRGDEHHPRQCQEARLDVSECLQPPRPPVRDLFLL